MRAIIKKELKCYFTSVIGYILLAGFVFINGMYFSVINVRSGYPDYSYVLGYAAVIFLIMIPILTMRLFSEESRQKTDQLLYTAPVKPISIVLGKFFSALLFLLAALLITCLFPLAISFFGPLPVAKITATFVGYFFLGAAFIAVGMFISGLTDNQIVAAFGSFALIFVLYNLHGFASIVPVDTASSVIFIAVLILGLCFVLFDATKNIYAAAILACFGAICLFLVYRLNPLLLDGVIYKCLSWFALMTRFQNFYSGILDLSDLVYYISFCAAFIYLTVSVIEKRRWR